jgi:hypothetical protein
VSGRVTFDVERPAQFSRSGVPLRFVVLVMFFLPGSINWVASLFYLPVTSALLLSQKGAERFFEEDRRRLTDLIRWVIGLYSYFAFLTDTASLDFERTGVRLEVERSGTPSTGSALRRIVFSLPNVAVFGVFGILALGVWGLAGVSILATGNYPRSLYAYQRAVNRWQARLFSYHTSLVDEYPSFRPSFGRET